MFRYKYAIAIIGSLFATSLTNFAANAGAFSDRLHENQARAEAAEQKAQEEGNWRQQLDLKKQISFYAHKHGGMRDAGECTSNFTTNCAFFAICVPTLAPKLTVVQLGSVGTDIGRCEVAFKDGSACDLSNDFEELWAARKDDDHVPKMRANCFDAHNVDHTTYQY